MEMLVLILLKLFKSVYVLDEDLCKWYRPTKSGSYCQGL